MTPSTIAHAEDQRSAAQKAQEDGKKQLEQRTYNAKQSEAAKNNKRWVDVTSDVYKELYGTKTPSTNEETVSKRDMGTFEEAFAEFFHDIAKDLYDMFSNWNINLSIEGIVMGRLARDNTGGVIESDFTHFGLEANNPWGVAGSIFYFVLRRVCVALMIIVVVVMLIRQLLQNTPTGRAELKSLCQYVIIAYVLLFITPYLVDLAIYARDVTLHSVKQGVNYMVGEVKGSNTDSAIDEYIISNTHYNSNAKVYITDADEYQLYLESGGIPLTISDSSNEYSYTGHAGEGVTVTYYRVYRDLYAKMFARDGEVVCDSNYFPCAARTQEVTFHTITSPRSAKTYSQVYYYYTKEQAEKLASDVGMFAKATLLYKDAPSFVAALFMLCAAGTGIAFTSYYVLISLLLTICFGFFPIILLYGFFNKKTLTGWVNIVVPCLLTQIIDFLLIQVPMILSYVNQKVYGKSTFALLIILLLCVWSIVPVRQRILKLIGFEPILSKGGGLLAAGMLLMRTAGRSVRPSPTPKPTPEHTGGTATTSSGGTTLASIGSTLSRASATKGDGVNSVNPEQDWLNKQHARMDSTVGGMNTTSMEPSAEDKAILGEDTPELSRFRNLSEMGSLETQMGDKDSGIGKAQLSVEQARQNIASISEQLESPNLTSKQRKDLNVKLEEAEGILDKRETKVSELQADKRQLESDMHTRQSYERDFAQTNGMVGMDKTSYRNADEYKRAVELQNIRKMQMDYKNFDNKQYAGILSPQEKSNFERQRALAERQDMVHARNRKLAGMAMRGAVGVAGVGMATTAAIAGASLGASGGSSGSSAGAMMGAMGTMGAMNLGRSAYRTGKEVVQTVTSVPRIPKTPNPVSEPKTTSSSGSDLNTFAQNGEYGQRKLDTRADNFEMKNKKNK